MTNDHVSIKQDAVLRHAVFKAISGLADSLEDMPEAWGQIDELSSRTVVDSVDASPDGVFIERDGRFEAAGIIYVVLNYGEARKSFSSKDSFPIAVSGEVTPQGDVTISKVHIDAGAFWEQAGEALLAS